MRGHTGCILKHLRHAYFNLVNEAIDRMVDAGIDEGDLLEVKGILLSMLRNFRSDFTADFLKAFIKMMRGNVRKKIGRVIRRVIEAKGDEALLDVLEELYGNIYACEIHAIDILLEFWLEVKSDELK